MHRMFGVFLAVMLSVLPVAAQRAIEEPSEVEFHSQEVDTPTNGRLYLILGGTVAGITGMWITLYHRGKK